MNRGEALAAISNTQTTVNKSLDGAAQVAAAEGKGISDFNIALNSTSAVPATAKPLSAVAEASVPLINQVATRSPSLPSAATKSVEARVSPETAAKYVAAANVAKLDSHLERNSSANDIADVKLVQTYLKATGHYTGNIDGDFGPLTEQAVKSYQASKGIDVVGKVGPQTRAALANDAANIERAMFMELQRNLGVAQSGVLDTKTKAALDAVLSPSPSAGVGTTATRATQPAPVSSSIGSGLRPVGFLNASLPFISSGQNVTLQWSGINAKSVKITDSATGAIILGPGSGSKTVSPQITTIYTALFIGDEGQTSGPSITSVRVR
ncbi:peptidoglycan-binding protein [Acetobacteraceae bacterium]|nr:peptidoglycan-binding protein [Candidatus Parcubacteria bacterium]